MGTLYVVSTPIGNLEDITLRAIRVLFRVDAIACEDTRKTGRLLSKIGPGKLKPKFLSYFEENEARRIPEIINLLKNGKNVALVSNAGTPTISDPGFKLVRACLEAKIRVEPIPGPSAVLAALVSSGLATDKFLFLGYLPKKQGKRIRLIENLKKTDESLPKTKIIYVSPYRLLKVLKDIKGVYGDIEVVLTRELTKIHEEIRKEKIDYLINHYLKTKPKGELVILIS